MLTYAEFRHATRPTTARNRQQKGGPSARGIQKACAPHLRVHRNTGILSQKGAPTPRSFFRVQRQVPALDQSTSRLSTTTIPTNRISHRNIRPRQHRADSIDYSAEAPLSFTDSFPLFPSTSASHTQKISAPPASSHDIHGPSLCTHPRHAGHWRRRHCLGTHRPEA